MAQLPNQGRIFSNGFPFARSSTSLSRHRICRMRESGISSTRIPQIFPVILVKSGGFPGIAEEIPIGNIRSLQLGQGLRSVAGKPAGNPIHLLAVRPFFSALATSKG